MADWRVSLGERLRVENAGTKEKKEREKKNIILMKEIIKYIIWF